MNSGVSACLCRSSDELCPLIMIFLKVFLCPRSDFHFTIIAVLKALPTKAKTSQISLLTIDHEISEFLCKTVLRNVSLNY